MKKQTQEVLRKHTPLFSPELGCFNNGVIMKIPFKKEVDLTNLKQALYPQSKRDREAIDEILNPI